MKPNNTITLGKLFRSTSTPCAACEPFRERYREMLIPVRLNDTGKTLSLGATCLKRIFGRYMADKDIPHRKLTGPLWRQRRTLIIDLVKDFPHRGKPRLEAAYIDANPNPELRISATEFRLYLQQDIIERSRK